MKKLIFTLIAIPIVLAAIGQCETRKYISISKKSNRIRFRIDKEKVKNRREERNRETSI